MRTRIRSIYSARSSLWSLFLAFFLMLLAACPAQQSASYDTNVQPAPTEPIPGESMGVTPKMKEDFLDAYRIAVTTNDPVKYLALICLDGMDDAMKNVAANGAQRSLSFVGGRMDALSFTWVDPDPNDTKPFDRNGYHYHSNLKPVIALTINIKRTPEEPKDLPTALQPTLGIKNGQLMILGMIHEKLPGQPETKKEEETGVDP